MLIDLRGELGRHALDYNLQVPLPLKLTLEEVNLLLGIDAPGKPSHTLCGAPL